MGRSVWRTVLLALVLQGGDVTMAQDPSTLDPEEMNRRWEEACTPGSQHEALARFLGTWDTTMRVWVGPGDPLESEGVSTYSWLFEGRWLKLEAESVRFGRPVEQFGVMGYDNFKKKYVAMWVDDATTALLTAEGNPNQHGDKLYLFGPLDEPMTGEHDKTVKYLTRWEDEDTHVLEVHDLPIGDGETKVIEVEFRRRK